MSRHLDEYICGCFLASIKKELCDYVDELQSELGTEEVLSALEASKVTEVLRKAYVNTFSRLREDYSNDSHFLFYGRQLIDACAIALAALSYVIHSNEGFLLTVTRCRRMGDEVFHEICDEEYRRRVSGKEEDL